MSPVQTATAPVAVRRHGRQREQKGNEEVDRDVADGDHGRVPSGRVRDHPDRKEHAVVHEEVARARSAETARCRSAARVTSIITTTAAVRMHQGTTNAIALLDILAAAYCAVDTGRLRTNRWTLSLRSCTTAAHHQEDVQDHDRADERDDADVGRHRAERHEADGDEAADDRAEDDPAHQVQIFADQLSNDRCRHAACSRRVLITVATKISSSVMRCTSQTRAPARS